MKTIDENPDDKASLDSFMFQAIGRVHSCFPQKFGVPRQPQLATAAEGYIEIFPDFSFIEAFRGLELFSHLWVHFIFHHTMQDGWRPTIRPPRLEGDEA